MCGRFNLRTNPAELVEIFALLRAPQFPPRYNIAPTQPVLAIRQTDAGRVGDLLHWGLVPGWAADRSIASKLINARCETVAEKPAFRRAFRKQRCLIPADGYYEWQTTGGKVKQPWHVFLKSGRPLAMAGVWETWNGPDNAVLESCAILTTAANRFMADLHDRMPLLLDPSQFDRWLDPERQQPQDIADLLVPCPDDWLARTAVSTLVNNVRNDSPACLEPVLQERSLF